MDAESMWPPEDWDRFSSQQRLVLLEKVRRNFDQLANGACWLHALELRYCDAAANLALAEAKQLLRVMEHLEQPRPALERELLCNLMDPPSLLGQKIGALGACGGAEALRVLSALAQGQESYWTPFVQKQWRKAVGRLNRRLAPPSVVSLDAMPWGKHLRWVMACVPGMETLLAAEVREQCSATGVVESHTSMTGEVWLQPIRGAFAMQSLQQVRQFSSVRIVLNTSLTGLSESMEEVLDTAMLRIAASALARIPAECTEGPIRFALRVSGFRRASGTQLARAARQLEQLLRDRANPNQDWINDPRDEDWVFHVEFVAMDQIRFGLEVNARHWDDRFAYRTADLPASSHPTIAAMLAQQTLIHLPTTARVLDPFCGSALELIEIGRIRSDCCLMAGDLSADALGIAKQLAASAGVRLTQLEQQDALQWNPIPKLHAVVTNPPFGRRAKTEDIVDLLQGFLARASQWLQSGGVLVWISPQPRRTAATLEQNGMNVVQRTPLNLGGIRVELQIARKR